MLVCGDKESFVLNDLARNKKETPPTMKKLIFLANVLLPERMAAIPPRPIAAGVPLAKI